jgi:hypothetical protein
MGVKHPFDDKSVLGMCLTELVWQKVALNKRSVMLNSEIGEWCR